MNYREEYQDLFKVPEDYHLVQCISADFGMGKGIAVEFNKRFDMKNILKASYPNYLSNFRRIQKLQHQDYEGDCILHGRVLNLVTKERYWYKPTYASMKSALERMRRICNANGIQKVAMPLIGCGLDKLEWEAVSAIIQKVFADENIEILVCRQ